MPGPGSAMDGLAVLPPVIVMPPPPDHVNVSGLLPTGLYEFDASGFTVSGGAGSVNGGLCTSMVGPPTITMTGGVVGGGTTGLFTFTVTLCVTVWPFWPVAIQV